MPSNQRPRKQAVQTAIYSDLSIHDPLQLQESSSQKLPTSICGLHTERVATSLPREVPHAIEDPEWWLQQQPCPRPARVKMSNKHWLWIYSISLFHPGTRGPSALEACEACSRGAKWLGLLPACAVNAVTLKDDDCILHLALSEFAWLISIPLSVRSAAATTGRMKSSHLVIFALCMTCDLRPRCSSESGEMTSPIAKLMPNSDTARKHKLVAVGCQAMLWHTLSSAQALPVA